MPAPTGPTAARMRSRIASLASIGRVVADQEGAAIEMQAARDARGGRRCRSRWCSGRTPGAAARECRRARLDVRAAPRRALMPSGASSKRRQRSSAFSRRARSSASHGFVEARRRARRGSALEVVVADAVVGGVVQRADEPGVGGDVDAARAHAVAHVGPVGHVGEQARVGAAAAAAAGAAVVRRLVRVVEAGRAVAEEDDDRREAARPGRCCAASPATRSTASSSEKPTGLPPPSRRLGRRRRAASTGACAGRGATAALQALADARERPRREHAARASAAAGERAEQERQPGAAAERARRRCTARRSHACQRSRRRCRSACQSVLGVDRLLVHLVRRRHDDRAVRGRLRGRRVPGSRWRRRRSRRRRR